MPPRARLTDIAAAVLAVLAIAVGAVRLAAVDEGLAIETARVGATPVTVTRPADAGPDAALPAVVIAHGFAGSRQLMQPFAATLARAGHLAVTFDFLGHGGHPHPLTGSATEADGATRALVDQTAAVAAFARSHPSSDGRLALLGHSMGSDIVVRVAQADAAVAATVAVSMFAPTVTPETPRNLLVIVGGLEPAILEDEGRRVVGMVAGGADAVTAGETYGAVADGTARRLVLARGVEHIGVLFSADSLSAARDWLADAFEARAGAPAADTAGADEGETDAGEAPVDRRLQWLGLTLLGVVLAARPLSRALPPVVAPRPSARPARHRRHRLRFLAAAGAPAVLTPLILLPLPTGLLPILLGDYLTAHFLVYGVLTAIGLGWLRRTGNRTPGPRERVAWPAFALAAAAVAGYAILAVGVPIDRYFTAFVPIAERAVLLPPVLIGTLAYFLADEALTRGPDAPRFAYPATKVCLVVSLAIAVALDPGRLFFLIILVPVIVVFLTVYGLFSGWAYRRTGHPAVAGVALALAFAWAIVATFPMVDPSVLPG